MELKTTYIGRERVYRSFEHFFEDFLDGDDYGVGRLERAQATASNNSKAIGKLCGLLHAKNLLTLKDIVDISGASLDSEPIFTPNVQS